MRFKKLLAAAIATLSALSISVSALAADSEVLEDGSVSGLPEGLYILDSDGSKASQSGEYYINIEGMEIGTTYTKTIQLTNYLDQDYYLTMVSQPVSSTGDLNLNELATIKLTLDGETIYDGKASGDGNVLNLGKITSGGNKNLVAEIYWDGSGMENVTGESYSASADFLWIFEAAIDEPTTTTTVTTTTTTTSTPNTGVNSTLWLGAIIGLAVIGLLVFVICKQNRDLARLETADAQTLLAKEDIGDDDKA